jgi:hypothetical protein
VPAHQRAHRFSDGAVADALAYVGVLRVEALRVADRELQVFRQLDQFIGLGKLERDRLLEEDVLACGQEIARDRIVRALRRRGDVDRVDVLFQQLLVIGCRTRRF